MCWSSGVSFRIAKAVLLIAAVASLSEAQTGLGVVRGTVQDASGAVVAKARVTLASSSLGDTRASETNSAGIFYFDAVRIGPYTVSVEAQGFKKWEGTLTVQAGQTVSVDSTLEVGSIANTVEVTGAAPLVATEGAQVADVKDALRIHDLPLNGRQITGLFDLTPGVVGGGNPRTNGMKVGATDMVFDGISYVDRFGGGVSRVQPGLDTVQEFRVETANSSAQFSRPATVELVTRSGTNMLHGALFETFRNNADGLVARARSDGNTPAKLIRNEYGGWAGGPVLLPKLYNGKNKTFWFVDWEGLKQRQQTFATAGVPTPANWNGDLSNITDVDGNRYTIYDPKTTTGPNGTRLPYTNNVIPTTQLSPYAKIFQSITPAPNIAGNLNPWTDKNFAAFYSVPQDTYSLTLRGDHNFSEKDTISGRFTHSLNNNEQFGGRFGYPPVGCNNCGGSGRQHVSVDSDYVRWNHVFSPTLINELELSGHRSVDDAGTLADSTNWAQQLGLPNPFGVTGWPTIYTDASSMLYYGGWDGDNRKRQALTAFQIDDNVTWIRSRHTIKAGFKGRQEFNNVEELQQAEGSHSFYNTWTALYDPSAQGPASYTGTGFGSLLLGLPTYLSNQYNRGFFYFQQKEIGLYVNDTWKVNNRLTVDLGLRWDHWTPYHEKYDRLVSLNPTNYPGFTVISPNNTSIDSIQGIPSGVLDTYRARGLSWVTADSVPGFPSALVSNYWKDFGPRLALAYRISNNWVFRGGYGIYYWPMPLSQILQASRSNPPLNLRFQNSVADKNGAVPNYGLLFAPASSDYLPNATVGTTGVQNGALPTTSLGLFLFDPYHWADDRMQQWTATMERQLGKNTSVRVSYIGTRGSNLEQLMAWNTAESAWNYQTRTGLQVLPGAAGADARRLNPNWNGSMESHVGYSNSHSIQAQVERRMSNGLSFQWSYTYDHALTTSDAGGFSSGSDGATVFANNDILGEPNLSLSQQLKLVYYNSAGVPPHQIKWNGIYELPFGRGKRFASSASRGVDALVGGWQIAFIGSWQSGNWFGVPSSEYLFGNPSLDSSQRMKLNIFGLTQELYFKGDFNPSSAKNVDLTKLEQLVPVDRSQRVMHPVGGAFDNRIPFVLANGKVALTTLTDNRSWNAVNFMLGPRQWNEDISFFKYFDIQERMKFRLTGDFFNFFNHPNSVNPNGTTGLINLGVQSNAPRTIQLGARLEF